MFYIIFNIQYIFTFKKGFFLKKTFFIIIIKIIFHAGCDIFLDGLMIQPGPN